LQLTSLPTLLNLQEQDQWLQQRNWW
jgi:hypothetical protein